MDVVLGGEGVIVGMTGARSGATEAQLRYFRWLLASMHADELHHGDCVGADEQAHEVARDLDMRIVVHPPSNEKYRAWCDGDVILTPQDYLVRNRAIVAATNFLIALPDGPERTRSGTWSTVRHARRLDQGRVFVIDRGLQVDDNVVS